MTPEEIDAASEHTYPSKKRVTLEGMKDKIVSRTFHRFDEAPELTICLVVTVSGFTIVGKSAPADPANFDEELGEKYAFEDALRQMWPLEGYLLKHQMLEEDLLNEDMKNLQF